MKIKKTSSRQRKTYTYTFTKADGKKEMITIRPGENGVTEADIKMLHSLDDSEVYHNLKNLRPDRTKEEKTEIEEWTKKFIEEETARRGDVPSKDEIAYRIEERFPRNYNLSLEYEFGTEDSDTSSDKNQILYELASKQDNEPSEETVKVRELMDLMTDKQRMVLKKSLVGYSLTDIAKDMGTSVPNVKKHYDKAINYIKENYKR